MKRRWTIQELKDISNENFLMSLIVERLSTLHPLCPLAIRLKELEKVVFSLDEGGLK